MLKNVKEENLIYKTTNMINGRIYIGRTGRDDLKYLGSGIYLLFAIKKWGKENFIRETIETNVLPNREAYWIEKYKSQYPKIGYNIAYGGEGPGKHSEETIEKMSGENNPMYGANRSGENNPMHNKKHTKKTKRKMSIAQSGENNHRYIDGRSKDKEFKRAWQKEYDARPENIIKKKAHDKVRYLRKVDIQYFINQGLVL